MKRSGMVLMSVLYVSLSYLSGCTDRQYGRTDCRRQLGPCLYDIGQIGVHWTFCCLNCAGFCAVLLGNRHSR